MIMLFEYPTTETKTRMLRGNLTEIQPKVPKAEAPTLENVMAGVGHHRDKIRTLRFEWRKRRDQATLAALGKAVRETRAYAESVVCYVEQHELIDDAGEMCAEAGRIFSLAGEVQTEAIC
jgi:hypothetical protein